MPGYPVPDDARSNGAVTPVSGPSQSGLPNHRIPSSHSIGDDISEAGRSQGGHRRRSAYRELTLRSHSAHIDITVSGLPIGF